MTNQQGLGARLALTGIGLAAAAMPAQAAFETITDSGTTVLKLCQGTEANRNPTTGVCKVTGNFPTGSGTGTFPGLSGSNWAVYATNNNQAVIANGTTIGNLDDRIWRRGSTTEYVFGFRLQMVNTLWTPPSPACAVTTPDYFEVNDMFRNGFSGLTGLQIAYRQGTAEEGAWFSGRPESDARQRLGRLPHRRQHRRSGFPEQRQFLVDVRPRDPVDPAEQQRRRQRHPAPAGRRGRPVPVRGEPQRPEAMKPD